MQSSPFMGDGRKSNTMPILQQTSPNSELKFGPGSTPPNMQHFTVLGGVHEKVVALLIFVLFNNITMIGVWYLTDADGKLNRCLK